MKQQYSYMQLHQPSASETKHISSSNDKKKYLCTICKNAIANDNVPKVAVPGHIRKNNSISILKKITELEERLLSLRFPFFQIRELGLRYQKPQLGLSAGVINVLVDISRIQHASPHTLNE